MSFTTFSHVVESQLRYFQGKIAKSCPELTVIIGHLIKYLRQFFPYIKVFNQFKFDIHRIYMIRIAI